jgi:hypothetical protein
MARTVPGSAYPIDDTRANAAVSGPWLTRTAKTTAMPSASVSAVATSETPTVFSPSVMIAGEMPAKRIRSAAAVTRYQAGTRKPMRMGIAARPQDNSD